MRGRITSSWLCLTGGEPTDWPLLTKVLDKVYEPNSTDTPGWWPLVITNMSKSKGFIDEWIDKTTRVIASYHPDVINTSKKRDAWFEKVLSFKNRTFLTIRIIMDSRHWDHCLETFNTFNIEDIAVEPVKLINFIDGFTTNNVDSALIKEYNKEQIEILSRLKPKIGKEYVEKFASYFNYSSQKYNSELILEYSNGNTQAVSNEECNTLVQQIMSKGLNRFKGWHCELGINNLFVDPSGDIANAVCMGARKKYIGNISDIDNIEWATKPTICPYDWCLCDGDVYIPKYKLQSDGVKDARSVVNN